MLGNITHVQKFILYKYVFVHAYIHVYLVHGVILIALHEVMYVVHVVHVGCNGEEPVVCN